MQKKFKIQSEIYPENFIRQGLSDFAEIGNISYENNIIKIDGDDLDAINEIFNELINYVTGLINE